MKQLVTFIPRTVAECRNLLSDLRAHRDGHSFPDRYGFIDTFSAEEITELIGLIKAQIGDKTPESPAVSEAPKAETPAAPVKPGTKLGPKSGTKTSSKTTKTPAKK